MKKGLQKESIAERTRAYIDSHPSIKDCIAKDLINFSSLARQIMKDMEIRNEEAVMIACRRYAIRLGKHDHERDVLKVLGDSRLEVKTKICIVTAKNDWTVLHRLEIVFKRLINEKAIMQVIQSAQALTIIADEKLKGEVVDAVGKENVLKGETRSCGDFREVSRGHRGHEWRLFASCIESCRGRSQHCRDCELLH
jgi:hypothetical protein